MKYFLILLLGITLGYFLCNVMNKPVTKEVVEISDGKHLQGTIVANATNGKLGMIEFAAQTEHSTSQLALYDGNVQPRLALYQEVYAKVKIENDIPIAYDVLIDQPDLVIDRPSTFDSRIDYHSFNKHGREAGIHKKVHWNGGALGPLGAEIYELSVNLSSGTQEKYKCNSAMKAMLESFGAGQLYLDVDKKKNVISADTCHMHGSRQLGCRSDNQ